MAKYRDPHVCNLKLLLIFLVIFGHLIEPRIGTDAAARGIYHFIYIFHMPLFAFLSGLYFTRPESCMRQSLSAFRWYGIAQGALLLLGRLGPYSRAVPLFFLPYWHLWYLFSLGTWALTGAGVRKLRKYLADQSSPLAAPAPFWGLLLAVSVLSGLLAGLIPWLGRGLSLSRTLVFLPYMLLGMLTGQNLRAVADACRKYLPVLLPAALALAALVLRLTAPEFLWQATPYEGSPLAGMLRRLLCLPAAVSLGAVVLALAPRRRLRISFLGADTLWLYLLHFIPVKLLWSLNETLPLFVPLCLLEAVLILALGGLIALPRRGKYDLSERP